MALCLLPRHRRHCACLIEAELVAPTAFVLNFMLISDINWGRPQSQYLILGKQMVIYPNQWKRAIHTKDDKGNLKNWRPISLLNVDYKICSKAISLRLAKVLGSIVDADQTCFSFNVFLFGVPERYTCFSRAYEWNRDFSVFGSGESFQSGR